MGINIIKNNKYDFMIFIDNFIKNTIILFGMTVKKVIHFLSLVRDIHNNQKFCFTLCEKCRKGNPEHIILASIHKHIKYRCTNCKLTQLIKIKSDKHEFDLLTREELRQKIKLIKEKLKIGDSFKDCDYEALIRQVEINHLIRYGRRLRFIENSKPEKGEVIRKLKIHIKQGLKLRVHIIKRVTGLSKKEIIELMNIDK